MSILYRFSKEVHRSRRQLGLTQEQAAEALSISVRWFQYIEAGERIPGPILILNIIALLEIDGKNLKKKE